MSCYLRHLHWLFEALDLEYDKDNRARVDMALRELLDLEASAGCPEVWATIKALPDERRTGLPPQVAAILGRA